MIRGAVYLEPLPRDSLQRVDDAYLNPFRIENGPLLNVQLQVLVRAHRGRLGLAGVTDSLELITQACAVRSDRVESRLEPKSASNDERTHHVRLIAHPLFVRECRDRISEDLIALSARAPSLKAPMERESELVGACISLVWNSSLDDIARRNATLATSEDLTRSHAAIIAEMDRLEWPE